MALRPRRTVSYIKRRGKYVAVDPGRTRISKGAVSYKSSGGRSPVKLQRAKQKAKRTDKQLEKEKTRQNRLIQLSKMPKGRGKSEYERIRAGGSLVETSLEKGQRQRKAQLAGMPEGRGQSELGRMTAAAIKKPTTRTQKAAPRGMLPAAASTKTTSAKKQMVKNPYVKANQTAAKAKAAKTAKVAKMKSLSAKFGKK